MRSRFGRHRLLVDNLPPLIRFGIVGLTTTIIDISCFSVLTSTGLVVSLSNFLSYSCGIAVSYFLNRTWTFRASPDRVRAIKFVASTMAGLVLSTGLVVIFNVVFAPVVSKTMSVPIVFLWNYLMARMWVFRQS